MIVGICELYCYESNKQNKKRKKFACSCGKYLLIMQKQKSQPLYGIIVCFCLFVVGAFLCFMNGIAEMYLIEGRIHVQLYGFICFFESSQRKFPMNIN